MKSSGIVRKLDPLGRIVIPKEIRKVLEIYEGDSMEIIKVDNGVVVKKYIKGCIFCGSDKDVVEFNGAVVCDGCRKALGQD
ncbi:MULTISPECIES: AbrB/MazE/SpoVT family DNA-binding domain-containing protein [Clostridium]|jgi:transcriptional pleiotropic regulator of transition state genes|uniref:SpoVT/AbrB family regulatory protein n=3 Tax=Clostridium TaxID=1485 RepID=A0AAV3W9L3_9CLOT|nr:MULTISPECIES: AbrB/MazE/SpoVT family DNA-binding domain-containing protein [Clostridium]NBL10352.1 AbrB/MazE/SpoVT family DNA-binding domain-containing protein [Escherichia coli]ABR34385.1 transcriptional regulator, AbrB family [Clostridium beijerinckii NCIMB 8052]AIU04730.1 AbrB family transcriptional regulator [Clostridium beijerinckii ATCC 35702]ALB46578.1 AbrB/MazE/SpoVT family DNA-binding domain-containing protein [Clostridium beijerinckii NRRL B-598]MBF7810997.1 AbrB/MazE/SpoVT family